MLRLFAATLLFGTVCAAASAQTIGTGMAVPAATAPATVQVYEQGVGAILTAASTITPTSGITHVTGTAAIATITPPAGMSASVGGCLTLIADAGWSTTTSGNIAATVMASANTPYRACYDGSRWYLK